MPKKQNGEKKFDKDVLEKAFKRKISKTSTDPLMLNVGGIRTKFFTSVRRMITEFNKEPNCVIEDECIHKIACFLWIFVQETIIASLNMITEKPNGELQVITLMPKHILSGIKIQFNKYDEQNSLKRIGFTKKLSKRVSELPNHRCKKSNENNEIQKTKN
jgi:hypothetical protein